MTHRTFLVCWIALIFGNNAIAGQDNGDICLVGWPAMLPVAMIRTGAMVDPYLVYKTIGFDRFVSRYVDGRSLRAVNPTGGNVIISALSLESNGASIGQEVPGDLVVLGSATPTGAINSIPLPVICDGGAQRSMATDHRRVGMSAEIDRRHPEFERLSQSLVQELETRIGLVAVDQQIKGAKARSLVTNRHLVDLNSDGSPEILAEVSTKSIDNVTGETWFRKMLVKMGADQRLIVIATYPSHQADDRVRGLAPDSWFSLVGVGDMDGDGFKEIVAEGAVSLPELDGIRVRFFDIFSWREGRWIRALRTLPHNNTNVN